MLAWTTGAVTAGHQVTLPLLSFHCLSEISSVFTTMLMMRTAHWLSCLSTLAKEPKDPETYAKNVDLSISLRILRYFGQA